MLSVIIVQYNHTHLTAKAIDSFRTTYRGSHEIIVVDNGSTAPFESPGDGVVVLRNPSNAGF
ncbi:MAG: glycosyltransferase, partial [Ignavibacteriales bacterium]|nr:glycosyltransferase [Ignavibacteriales bacterium]